jgi:hypothetical protein
MGVSTGNVDGVLHFWMKIIAKNTSI